jgi:hypothetical protein
MCSEKIRALPDGFAKIWFTEALQLIGRPNLFIRRWEYKISHHMLLMLLAKWLRTGRNETGTYVFFLMRRRATEAKSKLFWRHHTA